MGLDAGRAKPNTFKQIRQIMQVHSNQILLNALTHEQLAYIANAGWVQIRSTDRIRFFCPYLLLQNWLHHDCPFIDNCHHQLYTRVLTVRTRKDSKEATYDFYSSLGYLWGTSENEFLKIPNPILGNSYLEVLMCDHSVTPWNSFGYQYECFGFPNHLKQGFQESLKI